MESTGTPGIVTMREPPNALGAIARRVRARPSLPVVRRQLRVLHHQLVWIRVLPPGYAEGYELWRPTIRPTRPKLGAQGVL